MDHIKSIHNSIYNELSKKNQKIFDDYIIVNIDEDYQDIIKTIRNKLKEQIDNQGFISGTLISAYHKIYDQDELEKFNNDKNVISEHYLSNCKEYSNFVRDFFNKFGIVNLKIQGKPDHAFNLFKLPGSDVVYYADGWDGLRIGVFFDKEKPNELTDFIKYGSLYGIYDIEYGHKDMAYFLKIMKYSEEDLDIFDNAIKKINKQIENNKDYIISRVQDEMEIEENDLLKSDKLEKIKKIYDFYDVPFQGMDYDDNKEVSESKDRVGKE